MTSTMRSSDTPEVLAPNECFPTRSRTAARPLRPTDIRQGTRQGPPGTHHPKHESESPRTHCEANFEEREPSNSVTSGSAGHHGDHQHHDQTEFKGDSQHSSIKAAVQGDTKEL